jgi:prepilin-type N-terminal cleavage/methylation domain-containing protein
MDRLRAQRGTTLIEVLIVLVVVAIAMVALYELVDSSNKITKQQTEVADVQQSARIGVSELSRIIRQSRVGNLYFGNAVLPIANNSPGGTSLPDNSTTSVPHFIRKGTDVIEVRGVLLGDKYILDEGDVTCTVKLNCATGSITVTIPATTSLNFQNFPAGGTLSLATRTLPYYFVVVNGENQQVTVGGSPYLVPVYTAGLVTAAGTFNRAVTPQTFTITMDPTNTGAKELNATTPPTSTSLTKSISGGPIDVVRFFVDEGGTNATGSTADTHPSLAEAILDPATGGPSTGKWNIQTLVEDVEDFQIAYGVDGADGTPHDGGVSPAAVDESAVNKDEWVGNVANEVETSLPISAADANHSGVDAFIDTSVPPATRPEAVPALRSVWISLVVKSTDPDLVYNGPGARGIRILDSAAVSFSAATGRPYRRRPLSLAVSLRNNAFFNR